MLNVYQRGVVVKKHRIQDAASRSGSDAINCGPLPRFLLCVWEKYGKSFYVYWSVKIIYISLVL